MKLDMDIRLSEDDTASGTMILAFSNEIAEEMGMDPEALWDEGRGQFGDAVPEGATDEPYSDGEYTGGQYTFEAQPIEEFSTAGSEELSITREGDEYVVSGAMDMTDEAGELADAPPELLETFDFRIAVTFPGEVGETNGEIVGTNTVEWRPRLGEVNEMQARGSAVANDEGAESGDEAAAGASDGFPWWVVGALIGVLVLAAVVVLVVRAARPEPVARTDGADDAEHPIFRTGPPPGPRHDERPPPPDRPTGPGGVE